MTERRSSVLAVPFSGHAYGSRKRSSVSGGGLGAIRAEIVREPRPSIHSVPSIPSIPEEDEKVARVQSHEGQSPKGAQRRRMSSLSSAPGAGTISSIKEEAGEEEEVPVNHEVHSPKAIPKRRQSTVSLAPAPEFHAPSFGAPVFRMPGFEEVATPPEEEQINPLHPSTPTSSRHRDRTQSIAFALPTEQTRSISPTRQLTKETETSRTFKSRKSIVRVRQKSTVLPAYIKEADESLKRRSRHPWFSIAFRYTYYLICICAIYFSFIGLPLWKGVVYCISIKHLQNLYLGWLIFTGVATLYAFLPLLSLFDPNPPPPEEITDEYRGDVENTALVIPAYKSEKILPATIIAALKIFPADHIFVICNGNSPTPLDNSEDVCNKYGVNHIWVPIGSKITAEFVGAHVTSQFKYILRIDDDVIIPPNLPLATHLISPKVGSVSYCIRSVGENSTPGTVVQQWQDIEYKLAGLVKQFCSRYGGSATFAHGAIVLWDREVCVKTFDHHPGYKISEDWFFGHVCRRMGKAIKACSVVFVETETPSRFMIPQRDASRGGFGEMLVWKQRFYRWNFFLITDVWFNIMYILFSWKLGWGEIITKIFVFQEIYEALLYLATPFVLVCSLIVNWALTLEYMGVVLAMYFVNTVVFNLIHLRLKKEMVAWWSISTLTIYKLVLSFVNAASVYWTIYEYATYFANKHFRIVDDPEALEVVWRLQRKQSIFTPDGHEIETETVTLELFGTVPAQQGSVDLEAGVPQVRQVASVHSLRSEGTRRRDTIHPQRNSLWNMHDENEPSPIRRMTINMGHKHHHKPHKADGIVRRNTEGP